MLIIDDNTPGSTTTYLIGTSDDRRSQEEGLVPSSILISGLHHKLDDNKLLGSTGARAQHSEL